MFPNWHQIGQRSLFQRFGALISLWRFPSLPQPQNRGCTGPQPGLKHQHKVGHICPVARWAGPDSSGPCQGWQQLHTRSGDDSAGAKPLTHLQCRYWAGPGTEAAVLWGGSALECSSGPFRRGRHGLPTPPHCLSVGSWREEAPGACGLRAEPQGACEGLPITHRIPAQGVWL